MNAAIAEQRLRHQCITRSRHHQPADLVAWLGAVQAQDYAAARWALGLRLPLDTTDAHIERAFDEGRILRTHVMRPTWHFATPADIRWMLELTAPHVHRAMASYRRKLGLDTPVLTRAATLFERALRDGQYLTRAELGAGLRRAGLTVDSSRLSHLAMYAELEGVICSGPRRGKQFTYALLAERAADARRLSRDEALAELTRRYFTSHGPATLRDFVWWSGLRTADAKRGLEISRPRQQVVEERSYWTARRAPARSTPARAVHLLPIFDDYLVAYRDPDAVPHGPSIVRGSVTFHHALVAGGQVAGTWRTSSNASGVGINVVPLRRLTAAERRSLAETAARYGRFLNATVALSIA